MASIPQGSSTQHSSVDAGNNTVPLIIITILFFMWGLLTSMNDVLIPHLKSVYTLSYTQAMLSLYLLVHSSKNWVTKTVPWPV
jgi:FHS family L-fucose permease-like MFS transporter